MKKVLHYKADSYLPIVETWIYELIKNQKRYKPIVYTLRTENLDIFPTEEIRSLELKKGIKSFASFFNKGWNMLFNFYPGFFPFLLKDKPGIIHAHFGPSGYNFLFYKRLFRLPMVTNFYGYDLSQLTNRDSRWRKRYKKLFKNGNCFLVQGNNMKKSLTELGCPEEKIISLNIGIDLEKIKFTPRNIGSDGIIKILIASRFREKKGIPYAIEAFGKVKESHPELNLELTLIGNSDGSIKGETEKKNILDVIDKYNLKKVVRLLGFMPYSSLIEEAEKYHIFLSPSITASDGDNEGGAPIAIVEMSASGMPILSTRHCDIPEVVIDGKSGFLVDERDVDTLAEKLEFLVMNPKEWQDMGEYGRRYLEAEYDIKKQINRLEEIYDRLLDTIKS
jgi:colanic acid/amylovoran biosynthesis glycosyltransferase